MQKAITPIIAIVLLVFMTIMASAAAFVWINEVQTQVQESAGGAAEGGLGGCSRVNLISMRGNSVFVENIGCDTVDHVTLLIDGVLTDYDLTAPLAPGESSIISYTSLTQGENHCVKLILSGGQFVEQCSSAAENTEESGYSSGGFEIVILGVIVS